MATQFDISAPVEKLMCFMAMIEALDCEETKPQRQEPRPRCATHFSDMMEPLPADKQQLLAAARRAAVEPPHKPAGSVVLTEVYANCKFYGNISWAPLDHRLATAARKTEIEFFEWRGVCTKDVPEPWMKIIPSKWLY